MRARVVVLAIVLALFAAFLTRGAGPGSAPPSPQPAQPAQPADRVAAKTAEPPSFARDPFRFAGEAAAAVASPAPASRPRKTAAVPLPSPVRLVGFVRQGGQLRAALAIALEVVVAGVGEDAGGYGVLAVDEEVGVRLRDPVGREFTLPPPP